VGVLVLALFPLSVAYQHFALTETGSALFLMAMVAVSIWIPNTNRGCWAKVVALIVLTANRLLLRQALLQMAPVLALFHGVACWRLRGETDPLRTWGR